MQGNLKEDLPRCVSGAGLQELAFSSSAWHCVVLNSEPVHQTAKCVWMNVEDGSCTVRSADHPTGSLENPQNMPALYIVKRFCRLLVEYISGFCSPVAFDDRWTIRIEFGGRAIGSL